MFCGPFLDADLERVETLVDEITVAAAENDVDGLSGDGSPPEQHWPRCAVFVPLALIEQQLIVEACMIRRVGRHPA